MPKLENLIWYLKAKKINFETEHRFAAEHVGAGKGLRNRLKNQNLKDWRFDLAIPEMMIAFEYEGLNSKKSRHTTLTGYTNDCEKYNEAQKLGWTVLRYTAISKGNAIKDFEEYVKITLNLAKKINLVSKIPDKTFVNNKKCVVI